MAEETETIAAVGAGSKHDRMAEETETIAAVGAGSKHDRMAEETETIAAVGAGSKHDRMAEETETVADDRWVAASLGNGTAVLKLPVDGDKPLDVVGRCSE
jgi:predicted CoA-binding protein